MAADSKKDTPRTSTRFAISPRRWNSFEVPGIDMSAFVAARRQDVDALTAATSGL